MLRSSLFVLTVALAACSAAATPQSSVPPAATAPGGGDATPPPITCPDGQYATIDAACQAYPTLTLARATTTISPVRDHHTTTIVQLADGPYLYVFGGTDAWTTIHMDVQRAKIQDDGTLGSFEVVGQLPAPRAGHCMIHVPDASGANGAERLLLVGGVVVSGGHEDPDPSTVFVTIGADGKVAATAPGPSLPYGVMHDTCDVKGDWLYVLGGRDTSGVSSSLSVRAKLGADGSVGAFEAQTELNPKRSHHAAFIRGSRIYIVGGFDGNPVGNDGTDLADCIMADIHDDGTLGDWTAAGTLPDTVSVSSAVLYEDAVYLVGGLEEGVVFSDHIRRATFNDDGTLSAFATLPNRLPSPRGHVHETPILGTHLYSVGGQDQNGDSLGTVDVGAFAP